MAQYDLSDKSVAIIATDYFEQDELFEPLNALKNAGAQVDIIAPHAGEIKSLIHVEPGRAASVDKTLEQAEAADYDALVVPGGAVNADKLRMEERARQFIRELMHADKPVAIICHGPWLLISAGLAEDRTLTSYYTIQDDLRNAGAHWLDQEVVIDDNLITSRQPADLPAFNDALLQQLAAQPARAR